MNFKGKNILFLTSTNLSCNPRCLKEVKLLIDLGATVTVVAFNLYNWSDICEEGINKELPTVQFHYLETTRKDFIPWVLASLLEKSARALFQLFPKRNFFAAMAVSKRSWYLLRWIKGRKVKPDLIIAHNPAAFYPAYRIAKQHTIPFAIDLEDYHPGEGSDIVLQFAIALLMKQLMPLTVYNSFASPLIKEYTEKLIPELIVGKNIVVNNVFAADEFELLPFKKTDNEKLQLVWFSQFIDYGRGLEKLLPFLDANSKYLELTLIGNLREPFFIHEISNRKYINCLAPMSQKELNLQLSKYDVGLAIEDTSNDLNRDICLTNKIWAYFQAGLYVVASDTAAQQQFIQQHAQNGICINLSSKTLDIEINALLQNKEQIRTASAERFTNASMQTWENESNILKAKWNAVLQ